MRKNQLLFTFIFIFLSFSIQAQTNYGAEIVSKQTFGQGLMVTRAKIVPLTGVVSNFFFFNRANQPWNGNVWYEYDWEMRGKYPKNGWSQIRVRTQNGGTLKDAPKNVSLTTNVGNALYNYILIRKGNKYIYDIRKNFDIKTYNYNNKSSHGGNSASLVSGGPRVYNTGGSVGHIPSGAKLDYSLGVTAFDNSWAGSLPNGDYSRDMEIDYTRFYTFSGSKLNTSPQWQDEFNSNSLNTGKWQVANWKFAATQFTGNNIRFQNGRIILRVHRGSTNNTGGSSGSSNKVVHITKRNASNYALDGGNGGKNGQNVYLWSKNQNNKNQQWIELDRGNGYYSYQKMNTNFCIDGGNGGKNGQNVYLWSCNSNNQNQQWRKQSAGSGSYKLIKRNAAYTLNGGNGGKNGQNVNLYKSSVNHQNLNWFVTQIGSATSKSADEEEYSNFKAQKEGGRKVGLTWTLEHERTPMQYEIEYKNTAGDYEVIGEVAAIGDEDYQVYNFLHDSPETGDNTYRIKAVFADYTVVYLAPQMVSFDASSSMAFPNPSGGELFINLSDYIGQEVTLTLSDLSGKSYFTKNLDKDHPSMVDMDLSTYKNGFYTLTIKTKNQKVKVEKISLQQMY